MKNLLKLTIIFITIIALFSTNVSAAPPLNKNASANIGKIIQLCNNRPYLASTIQATNCLLYQLLQKSPDRVFVKLAPNYTSTPLINNSVLKSSDTTLPQYSVIALEEALNDYCIRSGYYEFDTLILTEEGYVAYRVYSPNDIAAFFYTHLSESEPAVANESIVGMAQKDLKIISVSCI